MIITRAPRISRNGSRSQTLTWPSAAILACIALTGCAGHSVSSLPNVSGPDKATKSLMTLTLTRPAATVASNSNVRRAMQIPNDAQSVDMRVYSGTSVSNNALNSTCVPVSPSQTSITLSLGVQQGTDTLTVTSYSGPCSPVTGGQGSAGGGTALTQFLGVGSVSPSSTSINAVFNAGNPIVLGEILPQLADIAIPVSWGASLGPVATYGSGKLNAFAIANATSPSPTLYVGGGYGTADNVGTEAGAFRSSDGGTSWSGINSGLDDPTVNFFWVDPTNNSVLLAATQFGGIFRSTNGGDSWSNVGRAAGATKIIQVGSTLYATAASGVQASADNGQTWSLRWPTPSPAITIAGTGSTIYIGLQSGALMVSTAGAVPVTSYTFAGLGSASSEVHDIVVDPASPSAVYVSLVGIVNGIFSDGLYASTDSGSTFTFVSLPASIRGAQALAFSPTVPHLLYVLGTGLATYLNGATTLIIGGYGDGRTITPIAGSPEKLYSASDQGLAISQVGATSYAGTTLLTGGLKNFIVRSIAMSGSQLMATMQDWSTAVSTDNAKTWTFSMALSANDPENGQVYINPFAPAFCYDLNGALSVSTDGCVTFNTVAVGAKIGSTSEFAASPLAPTIYVVTNKGILVAADGKTFVPVTWPVPSPVDIAIDPSNAKNIFVSSAQPTSPSPGSIYASHDGGGTWSQSSIVGTSGLTYPGEPAVVAVDPADSNVVVAATTSQVYRSLNGGASFAAISTNYLSASDQKHHVKRVSDYRSAEDANTNSVGANVASHVAFNRSGKVPLLAYVNLSGIFLSSDLGLHFHIATANAVSHSFEQPIWLNGRLCVATDGEGVICTVSNIQP